MRRLLIGTALALVSVQPLAASFVCYIEECLPAVTRFERTSAGLRAIAAGRLGLPGSFRTLVWMDSAWVEGERIAAPLKERATHCPEAMNGKDYAKTNDPESARGPEAVCADGGAFVYGGLQFYQGEGMSGRGGLVRYDKRTRSVEVRRLDMLREVSVNSIAAEGSTVWFGTTTFGECTGEPFAHGLVRYDWSSGAVSTWEGKDDGPLGFVIHDIVIDGDSLWIATELGISRLDKATGRWRHFVPEEREGHLIAREREPEEMLLELLRSVPRDCLRGESFENQLIEGLALFRPRFLRTYLQTQQAASWECPELRFLASRMPDFEALNRRLLSRRPANEPYFECIVAGFSEVKRTERGWRDLLVAQWRKGRHFDTSAFRYFRGDEEVADMLIQSGRGIEIVPQILGEGAVARLAPRLVSAGSSFETDEIIYALELAAHQKIYPDGTTVYLPPSSNQPWFADSTTYEEFSYDRWMKWSKKERASVVEAWIRWWDDIQNHRLCPPAGGQPARVPSADDKCP